MNYRGQQKAPLFVRWPSKFEFLGRVLVVDLLGASFGNYTC